jgi:hypothetical protein
MQDMEALLETLLAKLKAAQQGLIDLADETKTKDHNWNYGGGARDSARRCLTTVDQAVLAFEEALGIVKVERQEHEIVELDRRSGHDAYREKHESFGVIQFTRPTGRFKLVGTTTDALPTCVSVAVYRADRLINAELHTEHYFHKGLPIVEFQMSLYQWAEAICNMTGQQTPCTLTDVMGVPLERVPENITTPLEQILKDTKKAIRTDGGKEAFKEDIDALVARIPDLKLSAKKAQELETIIRALYERHMNEPEQKAKWAARRFTEGTEAAIAHARVEMDAALAAIVNRIGNAALKGELKGFEGVSLTPLLDGKVDGSAQD